MLEILAKDIQLQSHKTKKSSKFSQIRSWNQFVCLSSKSVCCKGYATVLSKPNSKRISCLIVYFNFSSLFMTRTCYVLVKMGPGPRRTELETSTKHTP